MLASITPLILTKDEEPNIGRTLAQLAWASEVVVIDSVSGDRTAEIAGSFPNVRVVERPFDNLASQWNFALAAAKTEWVLTLDADYFVPEAFVRELASLVPADDVGGYEATFRYAVNGKPLRASLYPPRAVLLRRDRSTNVMDGHTQRAEVRGRIERLREPLIHDDRKSFTRFVARQRRYMRDEARKLRSATFRELPLSGRVRKMRVVAPFAVMLHGLFAKGLLFDGAAGLRYVGERVIAELILSAALFGAEDE